MTRWCGHADGIESDCESVVVKMPSGEKELFIRLRVRCVVCQKAYSFVGPRLPQGTIERNRPFVFFDGLTLIAPLEMEEST